MNDHTIGNPKLLCSHALDALGCMQLSLKLSRSIATDKQVFKNQYWYHRKHRSKKKVLILGFGCSQINSLQWRTCLEKMENLSSCYYSCFHAIPMHIVYAYRMQFLCERPVRIPIQFSCIWPMWFQCVSRTPKIFHSDNSSLCLGIEMMEISRMEARVLSLDWRGE